MSANERRGKSGPHPRRTTSPTTADATPTLAAAILATPAGPGLDRPLCRALARLGRTTAQEFSTSWEGARCLVEHLTALGCSLETQIRTGRCQCRILHILKGNALAKQLASADGADLPEALARAALLACLQMEPPAE